MITRRTVLVRVGGLGAAGTLAGCQLGSSESSLSIHMEEVPREDLGQNYVVAADELEPRAHAVVNEGLANGTTVHGTKPIDTDDVVHLDGSYHAVQITERGTETLERPVLEATEVSSADGSVSDWGNLSRSDSGTLRCAVSTRDERDVPPCVVYGGNDSAFWPDLRFRYLESGDDAYYRLRSSEQRVTLDRYDYAFEPVAESRSAFADYAARELIAINFSTIDLSAEQRDILDTAAEEGIYEESPPPYSDALQGIVDRLQSVRGAESGVYVRYDESYYEAHFEQFWDG